MILTNAPFLMGILYGNFGLIETAQAEKAWLCRTCFIIQPFFSSSFSIVYTSHTDTDY